MSKSFCIFVLDLRSNQRIYPKNKKIKNNLELSKTFCIFVLKLKLSIFTI